MVNLRDIAEKCDVSVSAVSLAINKPHKISLAQKEKILKVAHELGYFNKKHPSIKNVLLVFDNFHDCYFGEYYNKVIYGILDTLYNEKISIQILNNFYVEYADIYENDGIIFVGKVPEAYIEKAKLFKIPFVLCGHPLPLPDCYALRFDIERGVHELMDYVVSCGHDKIALIQWETKDKNDIIVNKLLNAYRTGLEVNKINFQEKYVAEASFSNLQTVETALNKLLKAKPAPTAIFCTSDHFAYIAYRILKKWKVKIPLDISIVGFDGISVPLHLETPTPILTTVATDQIQLGKDSVALLKKLILKQTLPPRETVLPITLKIGDSVKRLK